MRRRLTARHAWWLLVPLLAAVVWGLRPRDPYDPALRPGTPPYLTIFLIDGLSQEVFRHELAAGHLPEMQRLIDQGTYVEDGVTAFPSMTGYAFYPVLTGHDAVDSGVLGLRWFDRAAPRGNLRNYVGRTNVNMNDDFTPGVPTLFERFPTQRSSSFNTYADRGSKRHGTWGWSFTMAKYRDHTWFVRALGGLPFVGPRIAPDWKGAEDEVIAAAVADLAYQPKVQWVTFASPDAYDHMHGCDSTYVALVRHIDTLIGAYRAESARLGLEGQRIYAVLSDHGVADISRNVDLAAALRARCGVRLDRDHATNLWTSALDRPLDEYAGVDGIVAVNGNTLNYLYFRHPGYAGVEGFRHRLDARQLAAYPLPRGGAPVNLVDAVLAIEGVELVAYRDSSGGTVVRSPAGAGRIEADGADVRYVSTGVDPLGYAGDARVTPLLDGGFHSPYSWLRATHGTDYPYAPIRLHRLLAAPDCGDLVVTAKPGYDLAEDYELVVGNYRGGHGGLRADQIRVPYILAGPGVTRGRRLPCVRAEDVGTELAILLGAKPNLTPSQGRPSQPQRIPNHAHRTQAHRRARPNRAE